MTEIRLAREEDIERIAQLYRRVYGDDYPFREFYDTAWIKRGIFDANLRWYVASSPGSEVIEGSAAIMLNAGDQDDLVAEIGRLVVHPDHQEKGIGTRLVEALSREAERFSDFAFAECRTAHTGSQIIFDRAGYQAVGIEPLAYRLEDLESVVYVCRLSENAKQLRRRAPAVIPEVYELASSALVSLGFDDDVTVAADVKPYTQTRMGHIEFVLEPMDSRQIYRLLKLGRENFLNPEVFGAFRLEHGYLKLVEHQARYLVLRSPEAVVGGIGYTWNEVEQKVEVFEVVARDDRVRGTLLERGLDHIEKTHRPRYVAVDVNAHAARLQRTLRLLGFAPVVYAPSMVYVMGERFDVVKMVKLRADADQLASWELIDKHAQPARLVERALRNAARAAQADRVARRVRVFRNLSNVQAGALASACRELRFQAGDVVFRQNSPEQALFIVLEGIVDIVRTEVEEPIATIESGEVFGEMGLIEALPRSAGAVCRNPSRLLVLQPEDFDRFVDGDPEAGVLVLRNLAQILSARLRQQHDAEIFHKQRLEAGDNGDDGDDGGNG